MKVVLLKDIRTTRGIYHAGYVLPAHPDGRGGWIVQIATSMKRTGRVCATHVPAGAARLMHDPQWRDRSACRDIPGDTWYPSVSGKAEAGAARKVCARCPVRPECARAALDNKEMHGIFAGISARQPGSREKLAAIAEGRAA